MAATAGGRTKWRSSWIQGTVKPLYYEQFSRSRNFSLYGGFTISSIRQNTSGKYPIEIIHDMKANDNRWEPCFCRPVQKLSCNSSHPCQSVNVILAKTTAIIAASMVTRL